MNNDRSIENKIIIDNELYKQTTQVTFRDPKDIASFEKKIDELNKQIKSNTGALSYDQIIEKTRYLDYLGKTWEALELYIDNFDNQKHAMSVPYNHNIAKLYEKLGAYDQAITRYEFLVNYFWSKDYYKEIAKVYKKQGNTEKYDEYMKLYKPESDDNSPKQIEIDANGTIHLQ